MYSVILMVIINFYDVGMSVCTYILYVVSLKIIIRFALRTTRLNNYILIDLSELNIRLIGKYLM